MMTPQPRPTVIDGKYRITYSGQETRLLPCARCGVERPHAYEQGAWTCAVCGETRKEAG